LTVTAEDPKAIAPNARILPEVLVFLPRALLALFPTAHAEVSVHASTIAGVIAILDARWPGIRNRLCDETPNIRRHLAIFCNGRRAALHTPLEDGDKVYVLTAVSGG
jgi:molybdopterin synthase sulfur carrier subunit